MRFYACVVGFEFWGVDAKYANVEASERALPKVRFVGELWLSDKIEWEENGDGGGVVNAYDAGDGVYAV